MGPENVGGAPPNHFDPSSWSSLTPDGLLALLRSRLEGLDTDIGARLAAVQQAIVASKGLSTQIGALQQIQTAMSATNSDDTHRHAIGADGTDVATVQWGEPPRSMTIQELLHEVSIPGLPVDIEDPDATLTMQTVTSLIEQLQTEQRAAGSQNEIHMVTLQSSMHQRTESISIVTSLLRGMHESNQEIARNLR
jgi:hypothetical protein